MTRFVESVLGLGLLALFGFVVWMSQNPKAPAIAAPVEQPDAAMPRPTPATIPEQLEQLSALCDRGVLTEDEFSAAKVELLARL